MSFLKHLFSRKNRSFYIEKIQAIQLNLHGWFERASRPDFRVWLNVQGDVVSVTFLKKGMSQSDLSDEKNNRQWARALAEAQDAGLIELNTGTSRWGDILWLIYKRLEKPAFIYTGMLFIPAHSLVLTIVSAESSPTGEREAIITEELMSAGKLSMKDFERSWARDPYDENYRGVDKSVLRFLSDDARYDKRFPSHPLSKVRGLIEILPRILEFKNYT